MPCLLVTVQPTSAQVEGDEQVQHLHRGVNTRDEKIRPDHDNYDCNADTAKHRDMMLNLTLHQSKAALDKSTICTSWSDHTQVLVMHTY